MDILKKIFRKSPSKTADSSKKKEVMVNISSVKKDKLPSDLVVVSESAIPEYCSIGNLNFEKKFHKAIELGEKLLKETPQSAGVHVNLMDAYFKVKK